MNYRSLLALAFRRLRRNGGPALARACRSDLRNFYFVILPSREVTQ